MDSQTNTTNGLNNLVVAANTSSLIINNNHNKNDTNKKYLIINNNSPILSNGTRSTMKNSVINTINSNNNNKKPLSQSNNGNKSNGNAKFKSLEASSPYQFGGVQLGSGVSKRKKQDSKTGKGLRHFSMKVCEKVRNKGITTYNEVADELVAEFSADPIASQASFQAGSDLTEPFDQKNIRRRVYDALNVLMAINIISKEKKEIKWIGLPTNAQQECVDLERERLQRLERIKLKKQQLHELIVQQIAFKNLIERNQEAENPDPNSIIKLPFIIVNTDKKTLIDCSISRDKSEYLFNFGSTFEIHDDFEILKRMGLAYHLEKLEPNQSLKQSDIETARNFLPEALRCELDEMLQENRVNLH